MEFNSKILLLLICFSICNCLNSKTNEFLTNTKESKAEETDIPIINVHMEEPDRDPLELKRYEDERRYEKMRVKDIENQEINDSRIFQQILASQNSNLGTLIQLEHSSSQLLKKVTNDFNK